jgi:2-C-methyl-D-erythritol 4-phosphate cytidylyltransferase
LRSDAIAGTLGVVPLASRAAIDELVAGRPALAWVLDGVGSVASRVVVVAPLIPVPDGLESLMGSRQESIVVSRGGANRVQAIRDALAWGNACDTVLICNADMPLIDPEPLRRLIERARRGQVVVAATPVKATVKRAIGSLVSETLPRERMCYLRGEKAFPMPLLERALNQAEADEQEELAGARKLGLGLVVEVVAGASVRVTDRRSAQLAAAMLPVRQAHG